MYTNIPTGDFTITTRNLNTAGLPSYAHAGFILYLDEENVVFFGNLRDAGLGDGIALEGISADVGWRDSKAGNYKDQYLRVRKVSDTFYFEYSADNNSWTTLKSCTNALWGFTPTYVGLFMKDWGSYTPYAAQFDFFDVAPDCPSGPNLTLIYVVIIVAVVAIVLAVVIVRLTTRNQVPKQVPPSGGIQEQTFSPSSTGPYLDQPVSATPPPRPSSAPTGARLCHICGAICRPVDEFCMNCGAHLKSVQ